jgi:tRNA(adenine34) deaminase
MLRSAMDDFTLMGQALKLAEEASSNQEVPVGAVLVRDVDDGQVEIVAQTKNCKESTKNPLHHAEILAIEAAARALGRWRLSDCTLYVTLEPCVMCAGAIVQARLKRVVYGAKDPKAGAVESLYEVLSDPRLNHRPQVTGSVRAEESSSLLRKFFSERR